jgi:hypothetical protein
MRCGVAGFAVALLFTCVITEACLTSKPRSSFARIRDLVSVVRDGHIATLRGQLQGVSACQEPRYQETLEALIKATDPKMKIPSQSTVLSRAQPTLQ